jgi:hypothetical protein
MTAQIAETIDKALKPRGGGDDRGRASMHVDPRREEAGTSPPSPPSSPASSRKIRRSRRDS